MDSLAPLAPDTPSTTAPLSPELSDVYYLLSIIPTGLWVLVMHLNRCYVTRTACTENDNIAEDSYRRVTRHL